MRRYLAIDIGASSGRHIVGWRDGDKIKTDEVFRFPNGPLRRGDALVWDIDGLLSNVKAGIAAAREKYPDIVSLSADTWGVDYVLMAGDGPIPPAYAYRDTRTTAVIDEVHARVPFPELYARTGTQFQSFNTLYQLFADLRAGRLERATGFLMLPEYLMFRLCGARAQEYTNATTTGLVSAASGEYDTELISRLGLPEHLSVRSPRPARRSEIMRASASRSAPRTTRPPPWRAYPWRRTRRTSPPAPGACSA